jgi:hypothetical protein
MSKFAKKIIGKIKKEEIKPLPKHLFILKEALFWTLFIIPVVAGGIALSLIFFSLTQVNPEIFEDPKISRFEHMLSVFPLIWILFLGIFGGISYIAFRNTKQGYKIPPLHLIAANIAMSIVFAIGFLLGGGTDRFEYEIGKKIPFLPPHEIRDASFWQHPEKGRIGGEVTQVMQELEWFAIEDVRQKQWHINGKKLSDYFWLRIKVGEKIKVSGKQISENTFEADHIFPWGKEGKQKKEIKN